MKTGSVTKCGFLVFVPFWAGFASAHGGLSSLGSLNDIGTFFFKFVLLTLIVWTIATYLYFQSSSSNKVGLKAFLYLLVALICIAPNLVLAFAGYEFFGAIICLPVGICAIILATFSVVAVMLVRDKTVEK